MPTTRHYSASRSTGQADADLLAALVLTRQLPERGTAPSTDRMLDTVNAVINGDGATGYEFNKVRDWVRRCALRAVAARIEPGWENHTATWKQAVAEGVLMHGHSPARVAVQYGTTAETVDAVVKAYQLQLKRLY
jgi:hypothetical protein